VLSDPLTPASDKKKDLFFFFLFLILFLATFREFFFSGQIFFERDTTVVELPARKLTVGLLKEGNFALWTNAYGNGQPFLANPKNAIFYPATILYLVFPLFTAFKLYYFIHVILGWLGLYYLCKSHAVSQRAAFLGASLFSFSGMYLSSFEFYNHVAALAWMPWILLVLSRDPRSGRSRLVLLSLLWALLILAGSPEVILFAALLAAAQSFLKPGGWRKRFVAVAAPFGLACLLTAAQLAPSFEMLSQTGREAQSVLWPLELLQLPNMAFPHVLGNDREPGHHDYWGWHLFDEHFPLYYSFYMGFGALLLFLFGLKKPWDRRRKILFGAFIVFFLLACGRYSPFFFLYRITPFVSSIRYPVKFFLGSVFCLSILAALGFDDAMSGRALGKKTVQGLVITAGLTLSVFLLFRNKVLAIINALFVIEKDSSLRELGRSIGTGLVFLAVYAAVFFLLARTRSRAAAIGWALIVLAVLDPVYHNRSINPTVPPSFFDKPPIIADLRFPLTIYRTQDYFLDRRERSGSNIKFLAYYRGTLYPFTAMGDGVRYLFNVDFYGTYPRRQSELIRKVKELPPKSQFKVLQYLGCNYFISDSPMFSKESARRLQVEGFPVIIESITERPGAPYIVYAAKRAATPEDGLKMFIDSAFDPMKEILTEKDIALTTKSGPPADVAVETPALLVRREVQGRGWYSANLSRAGVAVFPGNYVRGWQTWVDGKKAEVFEVNLFSKGVLVPAGEHEVVLRYLPGSFIWGAAVSLMTVVLLIVGSLVSVIALLLRVRRKARPSSS
jgi:hypothetical protein